MSSYHRVKTIYRIPTLFNYIWTITGQVWFVFQDVDEQLKEDSGAENWSM